MDSILKKKPWKLLLLATALALAATAAILFLPSNNEYRGKSALAWTRELSAADPKVREEAAAALKAMGPHAARALNAEMQRKDSAIRRGLGAAARAALPDTLRYRIKAALKLQEVKPGKLLTLEALQTLGPSAEAALPSLERALMDPDTAISGAAAIALARIGSSAAPALSRGLNHSNFVVVGNACYGLSVMGTNGGYAVPALIQLVRAGRTLAYPACDALGHIGAPSVPAVTALLGDSDAQIRERAVYTMGVIGPYAETALPLLAQLRSDTNVAIRHRLAAALPNVSPVAPHTTATLTAFLDDPDLATRLAALKGLMNSPPGVRFAADRLVSLLSDPEPEVRGEAALVLAQLRAVPANVAGSVEKLLRDADPDVRAKAQTALDRIRGAAPK